MEVKVLYSNYQMNHPDILAHQEGECIIIITEWIGKTALQKGELPKITK